MLAPTHLLPLMIYFNPDFKKSGLKHVSVFSIQKHVYTDMLLPVGVGPYCQIDYPPTPPIFQVQHRLIGLTR